jgi:hydrogenase-4 component E
MPLNSIDPIAAFAIAAALFMVGLTQFRTSVGLYALQSLALGAMAARVGFRRHEDLLLFVGPAVALLKGILVPLYLLVAARRIGCRRDVGMVIAPPLQLFLALGGLVVLVLGRPFHDTLPPSALPAMGIMLLGMLLMMTRRLAVSQILGFLVLENGMFVYTISQPYSMPIVVELGVLMDVLAGTMLAGIIAFRINKSFEHIDVAELKELRG